MSSTSQPNEDLRAALETRMGELASLLAEVAEALTYFPGELTIGHGDGGYDADTPSVSMTINARDWPSIQEIEQLLANWRELTLLVEGAPEPRAPSRVS